MSKRRDGLEGRVWTIGRNWAALGSGCYGKALSLHEVIGGQCEPGQAEPWE